MTKMKSILGAAAAIALLLSAQPAAAQQCCPQPDPCCNPCADWCDMCGDWELGVHALYWVPIACEYSYVRNEVFANPPVGSPTVSDVSTVKCSGDWGVRVFGRYVSDCSFIGLSYLWYQSKTASSTTGLNLTPRGSSVQLQGPARVEAKLRLEYQNVDVRWGKYLHRNCGCNFYLFGNARWVDLSFRRSLRGQSPNVNLGGDIAVTAATEKSELQGGALGVGAGANFDIWCDFGLFGEANLLGVIAERSTRDVFEQSLPQVTATPGPSAITRYPSNTCVNPAANIKIGADYHWTCGCWTFVGEIGYEFDYYWNAVAFLKNGGSDTADPGYWELRCEDVGFSGLFFGGRILF